MNLLRVSASLKLFGKSIKFIINGLGIFILFSTRRKRFQGSYMNIVSSKDLQILCLLLNGRNQDLSVFAAYNVSTKQTVEQEADAYVVYQKTN